MKSSAFKKLLIIGMVFSYTMVFPQERANAGVGSKILLFGILSNGASSEDEAAAREAKETEYLEWENRRADEEEADRIRAINITKEELAAAKRKLTSLLQEGKPTGRLLVIMRLL